MVGRELSAVFPKREVKMGDVSFEIRNLNSRSAGIRNVNLSVRAGEIVGVAGLVGAGRTELAKVIFGLEPKDSGEVVKDGRSLSIGHPIEAINHGIAYLPEDRRRHGVVLDLPISANITLASLKNLTSLRGMSFSFAGERLAAAEYTRRLGVKTPAIFKPVSTLSGGNQQKVALSRWLMTKPSVLILDEPTQGIDVGAKSEIHELMMELAESGVAIVLISSELPEILGMSDRIAVMRNGTIVRIFDRTEATQDSILAAALGHNKEVH
jgi:rhamnose transport system ATP-binding protein